MTQIEVNEIILPHQPEDKEVNNEIKEQVEREGKKRKVSFTQEEKPGTSIDTTNNSNPSTNENNPKEIEQMT